MMRVRIGVSKWLGALGVALAVAGCGGGGGGTGGSSTFEPEVRYLNASPDSTRVSFAADGETKASNLAYLGISPTFSKEDVGQKDIEIFVNGKVESDDARTYDFETNKSLIITAGGLVSYGTEFEKRVRLNRFEVDRNRPNGNRARVYLFHGLVFPEGEFIPNLTVSTPGDNPQFEVSDIGFTTTSVLDIDSGAQTLVVKRNGTDGSYFNTNVTLDPGGIYFAVISGVFGKTGVQAPKLTLLSIPPR